MKEEVSGNRLGMAVPPKEIKTHSAVFITRNLSA